MMIMMMMCASKGKNANALHTMVSRRTYWSMWKMLEIYEERLSSNDFRDFMNFQSGSLKLGLKDIAIWYL